MIISAAVKATVNGEENVFPVMRHADFFLWMKLLHCQYDKASVEQGFIDWNELEQKKSLFRAWKLLNARKQQIKFLDGKNQPNYLVKCFGKGENVLWYLLFV